MARRFALPSSEPSEGGHPLRISAANQFGDPLAELTPREAQVLNGIINGRTDRQIAADLEISRKTVSNHVSVLLLKLHVRSRTEAAVLAVRSGAGSD